MVTHDRKVNGAKCEDTGPATPGDPEYPYVGKYVNTLTLAQVRTLDCGSQTLPDFPSSRRPRASGCRCSARSSTS